MPAARPDPKPDPPLLCDLGLLAEKFQISRRAQDEWAVRSQQRFSAAQAAGKFAGEIVRLDLPGRKGPVAFDTDGHNRPKTTIEALATLHHSTRRISM